MKCSKCGKEIADDSQFCEFCGAKVIRDRRGFEGKPGMKWLWLVLGLIGLVVLGWYAFLRTYGLFRLVVLIVAVALIVLLIRKFVKSRK